MKSFIVSAIFVGAALAQAPNLDGLPDCAKSCVNLNNLGGCKQFEIKCICSSKSFIDGISCCVAKSCPNKSDQENVIKFAQGICGSVGVTNLPTAPGCAGDSSSAGGSGSTSAPAATGGSAVATSGSGSSTASDGSGSPEATGASASAGSSPTPSSGAAGHIVAQGAAAVGGMMLAALL